MRETSERKNHIQCTVLKHNTAAATSRIQMLAQRVERTLTLTPKTNSNHTAKETEEFCTVKRARAREMANENRVLHINFEANASRTNLYSDMCIKYSPKAIRLLFSIVIASLRL